MSPNYYNENSQSPLSRFCRNLTEDARNGKLDPVIGRDDEIRRAMQVLARRTKNNPVLVGEAGVGKTAIVEGLAQRIASGDVPESLSGKEILALDMGALIAGAKFQGEFEERFKGVVNEIRDSQGSKILFIDEIHTLAHTGGQGGGAGAADLIKPALSRGEIRTIGATTLDEYRKFIEKDKALERRFQTVFVSAPTVEDAIAILRGLKERYEVHHGVRITDEAIIAAATLSDRYITNRFLPDKAIDLVDEAASRLKIEIESQPVQLDALERKILSLTIEEEALKKETDAASQKRLAVLQKEIEENQKVCSKMKAEWNEEKDVINQINAKKEALERAKADEASAIRLGGPDNMAKAAELRYSTIPQLEKDIEDFVKKSKIKGEDALLRQEVRKTDIASVVSLWTGIPVAKMSVTEKEKFVSLEDRLSKRVLGQKEAVRVVAKSIIRTKAGIADPSRPMGVFLFLGPTGVGKTELAKSLSLELFDSEKALKTIDMSEFSEKFASSRLIGAPPGYVGYDEGGTLTEAVRQRPYSVVLFDEVEKAHPEVFNLFLQLFDEGRLTDSQGREVNFKNTVIILTSNIGSQYLDGSMNISEAKKRTLEDVRSYFRPELLNRIDGIVVFNPLGKSEMEGIALLQANKLKARLAEKDITLNISPEVIKLVASSGNSSFGARPIRRALENIIENPLAERIVSGEVNEGDTVDVILGSQGQAEIVKK